MAMKLGTDGLNFIKKFEAFVPFLYDDFAPKNVWKGGPVKGALTIGYGHTKAAAGSTSMAVGATLTEPQAAALLLADLAPLVANVNSVVTTPLTQHQFDALVSFKFNTGRLAGTGLLTKVNDRQFADVPGEFKKWVKSKGKVLQGLKNRRQGEIDLFNAP